MVILQGSQERRKEIKIFKHWLCRMHRTIPRKRFPARKEEEIGIRYFEE